MKMRWLVFSALHLVCVAWLLLIASGSPWLLYPLPGGLPLGNLLTALALSAFAGAALLLAPRTGPAFWFAVVALLAALAWLPVSIALAGNVDLNFRGDRGTAWALLSLATFSAGLVANAWSALKAMHGQWLRSRLS